MRTTRTLAIASALGLGMAFVASANVVYDSETTNAWFGVNMSTLKTSDLSKTPWAPPTKGGEAAVVVKESANVIRLDTDLDDPLTYAASGSADVAVVAAEMTATVNATAPQITADPQAALAVVGDATAAHWVGLVGNGNGGTTWVTFLASVPVVGNSYSVRIEFDQRPGEARRIRYLVDGVVLLGEGSSDGWYPNPQTGAAKISNVSFSGSGDIAALDGENIIENTIAFKGLTQTNGFDYTNGTIKISADIQGYENVKAVLKLVDFGTGSEKPPVEYSLGNNTPVSWDLSALTAGGTYAYTIEAKDAGGNVIATKTGTFTAAHWPTEWPDIWFGADATSGAEVKEGGKWDLTKEQPVIEGNAYLIEDDALFNVDDQKPGSNHVTRVDTKVTFETLVDSSSLEIPEDVALGGFVAAKDSEAPQWMALTAGAVNPKWVALEGDITPAVNKEYIIRAEVDFISDTKRVRFLVSNDDGITFHPLTDGTSQWIDLATQEKYSLAAVELKGSGRVAKFEATIADKAVAEVNGKKYDTMAEALAAAGTEGTNTIKLLTNATFEPTQAGSYDIAPNNYRYASGGQVLSNPQTIVITNPDEPPVVRPSNQVMAEVKTPGGAQYKNVSSLRDFLERNGVTAYKENGSSDDIKTALNDVPEESNGLTLWEDYVMGIEPADSVDPVTIPTGDTANDGITLSIPAIAAATPSGDYGLVFKVVDAQNESKATTNDASAIKIPLATGTYRVKLEFTKPAGN